MNSERTLLTMLISRQERDWLDRLVAADGGGGRSAFIRRFIRREALRHGLTSQLAWTEPNDPQPEVAV